MAAAAASQSGGGPVQLAADNERSSEEEERLTFAELGVQREGKLSRWREAKLKGFSGELFRLFAQIESHQSAVGVNANAAQQQQPSPPLKVGIVLMTREPHRFDWWLRYHRSLGIEHVFVRVENTPGLLPLLRSDEFAPFVTIVTNASTDDGRDEQAPSAQGGNYYSQFDRQEDHVRRSTQLAKERGIEWLFHVDDDELLHFDVPMSTLVADSAPGTTCLALINAEAVPTSSAHDCVFEEIQTFTLHRMLAYRNGKAAGAIQAGGQFCGPHRFMGKCHVVPVAQACVLHFESCTYEAWRQKFLRHTRHCEGTLKAEIPFPL
jgi:hypothetical protein